MTNDFFGRYELRVYEGRNILLNDLILVDYFLKKKESYNTRRKEIKEEVVEEEEMWTND